MAPDKAGQAETPTVIAFSDFSFTYRSQTEPTLHNIRLTVRQGEKILIAGPSGSGKSTLAHCINGLIPHAFKGAASGSLALMGKDIFGGENENKSERSVSIFDISKIVGTVLQDTDGQFVALTAAEDIAFAAENDCVPLAMMKQRVLEAATLVRIEEQLAKSPHDLSGGQKQRVSLAGVLIDNVDILLFDEPLANLDPATGAYTIELIERIHRETGKTIIIVEHRIEDVLHCPLDRIIIIEKGRISADMPPDALLSSGLLSKAGLREPLYLSALRYAGSPITREQEPEHISRLRLNNDDAGQLRIWAEQEIAPMQTTPPHRDTLLEVKDVSFHYPEDPRQYMVLNEVSFSIKRGEQVSLIGKNGAGKSTLAKLITGFYKATAGSFSFEAHDMASLSIKERAERIAYVMQNPNQMISFPGVFDEVALALRSQGMPEAEVKDRVYEALRVCGIYPFRNWPVSALSYGQKKRLTIAAVLVMGVSLLILDEPTAGQDFRHYSEIMAFLRRLNQEQGLALLMITHDMHLMLEHTTRAIVIAEGRVLADAPPAAVLTNDELISKANLKRTSLYDLALKAGIKNPQAFVQRFIDYERGKC
jgi:energy-coupling factor transport system ATP-binding protein